MRRCCSETCQGVCGRACGDTCRENSWKSPGWLVGLSLFLVCTASQFLECVYVTESQVIATNYNVSVNAINVLGMLTCFVPFLIFLPAGYVADRYGSYTNVVVGCVFLLLGVWLRTISSSKLSYHLEFFATVLIALADGFLITLFMPVTQGFFSKRLQTFVLCILQYTVYLGPLLVAIFSKVAGIENWEGFQNYAFIQAAFATVCSVICLCFFRNPEVTKTENAQFFKTYSDFFRNCHFLSLIIPATVIGGLGSTCLILIARLTPESVDPNDVVKILIISGFFGGIIGTALFGVVPDRGLYLKLLCLMAAASCFFWFGALIYNSSVFIYFATGLFGFFAPVVLPICANTGVLIVSENVNYPVEASVEGFAFLQVNLYATILIYLCNNVFSKATRETTCLCLGILFIIPYLVLMCIDIPQRHLEQVEQTIPLLPGSDDETTHNTFPKEPGIVRSVNMDEIVSPH